MALRDSRRSLILSLLVCTSTLASCGGKPSEDDGAYEHVMSFDTARVRLQSRHDTLRLGLELAVSSAQKTMGLMERRHLPEDGGMLFLYDSIQPGDAGFWMYRTRIPLDIAFLDSAGVVRAVRSMTPCPTTIAQGCPVYTPDVPYRFALELNAGFFARHGMGIGDSLLLRDLPAGGVTPQPAQR